MKNTKTKKTRLVKLVLIIVTIFLASNQVNAQTESKLSIAVANPNVDGLQLTPQLASKMIQLELIKLDKFLVYDEFDMAEVLTDNNRYSTNCYGLNCLISMGEELHVDYIMSGSFNNLGNKIAISLKWVDVKNKKLYKSVIREFDNQEGEIQRMIKVLLYEMNNIDPEPELEAQLSFKNELIISNDVGKVNNSGPRVGYAYMVGSFEEFAKRSQDQGGLDVIPAVSTFGYQFEKQYVGTENFSALVEGVFNITGLEQGLAIPSISILNGLRFGKSGWEFAFGPSFTLRRTSKGFFDTNGDFGKGSNAYFSESDWGNYATKNFKNGDIDSVYYDDNGTFTNPTPFDIAGYNYSTNLDARGNFELSANWLMAFGRTFKAGALNIPVNLFYSSNRGGGLAGLSVGFNVTNTNKKINPQNIQY